MLFATIALHDILLSMDTQKRQAVAVRIKTTKQAESALSLSLSVPQELIDCERGGTVVLRECGKL